MGSLTVANAGHIPPFLDGVEVHLHNSLPLGLSAESEYQESTLRLEPNQQLTLLTDGVVEARNKKSQLYGFERTSTIATLKAEEIAEAAQTFGQEDDITVVTVKRTTEPQVVRQLSPSPVATSSP